MLNNYAIVVGFIEKEPEIETDMLKHSSVCCFNLVTKDGTRIKTVNCMATGRLYEQLMAYGKSGTFWAMGGVLYNLKSENMKKSKMVLKCLEIELLHQPKIPGIGVEEFVGKYSNKKFTKG